VYSSGMQMRLAFSVATAIRPDILIVDEALSVGDAYFQHKSFDRIREFRKQGTTLLIVSHDKGAIQSICDRAILLDSSELLATGKPKQIVGRYQKLLYAPSDLREKFRNQIRHESELGDIELIGQLSESSSAIQSSLLSQIDEIEVNYDPSLKPVSTISYASYGATIHEPAIYDLDGRLVNNLIRGKSYIYRYKVSFEESASNVRFGMLIKTVSGVELGGAASSSSIRTSISFVEKQSNFLIEFRFDCLVNPGVYFMNAGVVGDLNGSETYLHRLVDIAMFRVISESDSYATGIVDFFCIPKVDLEY
jgi:lipopolysaccharide transport system ATP-binding protein